MSGSDKEFTVFNLNMSKISFFYGIFLILWAITVSVVSSSESITSFIPSFFGFPILIFSFLSIIFESKQKLFMHLVVFFGFLIFLSGLDIIRGLIAGQNIFENYWAGLSRTMMLSTGFIFCALCIKSFKFSRKIKEADENKTL